MRRLWRTGTWVWLLAAGLGVIALLREARSADPGEALSIEGTYRLVYRELPDGQQIKYPRAYGLLTYANGLRHFNFYWMNLNKRTFSMAYVAKYKFDPKEYHEESLYCLTVDGINDMGPRYDLAGIKKSSPVKIDGKRIGFQLPLYNEPEVVFEGDKMTATRAGEFVDHWERVK